MCVFVISFTLLIDLIFCKRNIHLDQHGKTEEDCAYVIGYFFICLFSSHSIIFHSYQEVTITGEGLPIFFLSWHSLTMSNEGSLTCHSYCDTGHPIKMVISEDLRHLLLNIQQMSCHHRFFDLDLSRQGFEHLTFPLRGESFYPLRHRRCCDRIKTLRYVSYQITKHTQRNYLTIHQKWCGVYNHIFHKRN